MAKDSSRLSVSLSVSAQAYPQLSDFLDTTARVAMLDVYHARRLRMAVEEAVANIINYSGATELTIVAVEGEGRLVVTLSDDGAPFDPTAYPEPDLSQPADKRKAGGLGIHFMRQMSDSLAYRLEGNRNILTITTKMQFKVIHIDETDSTNRWLRDYPASKEMVVVADYQTAGRGCGTNKWESERGKNLTFSLLLHPEAVPAKEQFRITEWVSVALCETIEHYIYNKVEIKWPNDIYVENRKLCGILIENRLTGTSIKDSIIGIGLNVNQQTFWSDAPNPISIRQLVDKDTDREKLLADFLRQLGNVMERPDVSEAYRQRLWRREGMHPFRDAEGEFDAKVADVEADGHLMLEDSQGKERKYAFKEVEWILSFTKNNDYGKI